MRERSAGSEWRRPADETVTFLRCGGFGELRRVKALDAHRVDLGGDSHPLGAAFVIVYFCRGSATCEARSLENFSKWLE